ncbi:hypothetical protein O6H91_17G052500 [Diphasiastrum complanatum]|nr:hypothetical protein O6H91_17G052500 [Diphasiastrum complanatum]
MRSRVASGNHPTQPLSPKQQPWAIIQAPHRQEAKVNRSKSGKEPKFNVYHLTVQQEIRQRKRIEQHTSEKIEKLHEAVSLQRQARKIQREKVAGQTGEMIKFLQEQGTMKSSI